MSLGEIERSTAHAHDAAPESRFEGAPPDSADGVFYRDHVKPYIDRLAGGLLLLVLLPLIVFISLIVKIKLGSPVLYRQRRVGQNGKTFELLKFRTMIPDRRSYNRDLEGPERRKSHKSPDDPRVVPVARALRAWRFDELPQFLNVVRGDMSLVGPRPEMPEIVAGYEEWQHRRHQVKPGITGPWQISDQNAKLMHQCTELDLEYIDHITFTNDIMLLARTPLAMFGKRKGY